MGSAREDFDFHRKCRMRGMTDFKFVGASAHFANAHFLNLKRTSRDLATLIQPVIPRLQDDYEEQR
jgi:hypothetical protein